MKNIFKTGCWLFILLLSLLVRTPAQKMQSDNGDGTYTNPLIYADFPDPDVIRVDSVYSDRK